jgi:phosphatidylserine/phosphatidylglycerophosphate/cardiolipin synthase-like enzyme
MLGQASSTSGIDVHFLSQVDGDIGAKPIEEQAALGAIEAQAGEVATLFAEFVAGAKTTLDVCIYDFRLDLPSVSNTVVKAINEAAQNNVAVRIAYDKNEQADESILKQFRGAGGDPAPTGTEKFITSAGLHPAVQIKPIAEEAITAGSRIMHNKYMVRDHETDDAAVWMGSTNFTVDAWALQENNIVIITACKELAAGYTQDFNELWKAGALGGTGAGDSRTVTVNDLDIKYAFAPGEGATIETLIATAVASAEHRVRIASMVTSSPKILEALKGRTGHVDLVGIYDYGETQQVLDTWRNYPADAPKVELLETVIAELVPKHSQPFVKEHADRAHNFMHNKIVVCDDTIVTGSFNFSTNATHNAENVISLVEPQLADAYATYIEGLVHRYK